MAIDRNLLSGGTTMLLLKLLEEKDMYGYEMIENLRLRSNDVLQPDKKRTAVSDTEAGRVAAVQRRRGAGAGKGRCGFCRNIRRHICRR